MKFPDSTKLKKGPSMDEKKKKETDESNKRVTLHRLSLDNKQDTAQVKSRCVLRSLLPSLVFAVE
jgi:hypothetical protein